MARRIDKKPITGAMYRHFAAVTLFCTLALAMFADGENREAVAREVDQSVTADTARAKATPIQLVRKNLGGSADAGGGFDGTFGQPMDTAGAAARDGIIPTAMPAASGSGLPSGYNTLGISSEVWAALSDEQKKKLMAAHKAAEAAAAQEERGDQIESLLAASRERSTNGDALD